MPPKPRLSRSTSGSSSSSSSSSSGSSSSSSSGSGSSSDSDSSANSKHSSPTKSPKRKEKEPSSAEKNKKKPVIKKSGFVTNANAKPRPISDEDSDGDVKKKPVSTKKQPAAAASKPKVVPKKSATAKPVGKDNPGSSKSKKYVDTESDSELDDLKIKPTKHSNTTKPSSTSSKATNKKGRPRTGVSSESEDTDNSLVKGLKGSPSPPLLTPQKSSKKSSSTSKPPNKKPSSSSSLSTSQSQKKPKPSSSHSSVPLKPKPRTRNSSIDSILSTSADSDDENKKSHKKSSNLLSPKKKYGKSPGHGSNNINVSDTLDSDTEASAKLDRPTTRKQTRGTQKIRSAHVTGKKATEASSDSDSETDTRQDTKGKVKAGSGAGPRKPDIFRPRPQYPPIERRRCPVSGCDSSGHLSGKLDKHFTQEACPVFHNTTPSACREAVSEYNKKDAARKKAMASMRSRSPLTSPTAEHRRYLDRVKEERKVKEEAMSQDEDEEAASDRETSLKGLVSNYDLKMFREAQAKASVDIEQELKGLPDVKGTKLMEMGRNEMVVWYQSPYPEEYTTLPKIFICEFCLKYMKFSSVMRRHASKCVWKHPPGDEIYRKDKLSVFEVCGKKYKQYCQNLCLIAKSFLDHKTLYYDVEPFLFYVMTTADTDGCHIVGYFSKEKNSYLNYNVSCILTLPPYQRQGYGRLLIDFSYLLSRMEGKIGSPEKPLSDLGLISYRAYWKDIILKYLCTYPDREISFKAISEEMGIQTYDIVSTLQYLGMIKYWRGKHVILKKEDIIVDYLDRQRKRMKDKDISAEHLKWKPYEPTAKEKKQAEKIKKKQEERQRGR